MFTAVALSQEIAAEPDFELLDDNSGVRVVLSDATERSQPFEPTPTADAVPLDAEAIESLLSRVSSLDPEDADKQAFALRKGSMPPPRTGEDVDMAFGEPGTIPTESERPVEVLRYAPEGEIDAARHLSITFNQPMVPLTSQDAAAEVRPVTITPEPAGQWRWIGTSTLLFEPEVQFPKATVYKVEAPGATWSFRLPAPEVVAFHPQNGPHDVHPELVIVFDQRVEPHAILEHLTLRSGSTDHRIALVEPSEEGVIAMVDAAPEGRSVVFRAVEPLPKATSFDVVLAKGAPSAEGPLTSIEDLHWSFHTYGPMVAYPSNCTEKRWPCGPGTGLQVSFSNPIAEDQNLEASTFRTVPALELGRVHAHGFYATIDAPTAPRTSYRVTVPAGIADIYGQTMAEPQSFDLYYGKAGKSLVGPRQHLVTLDPSGPSSIPVTTVNHGLMRVRVNELEPNQWDRVVRWYDRRGYRGRGLLWAPGRKNEDTWVGLHKVRDEAVDNDLALSFKRKDQKQGHFLLYAAPAFAGRWNRDNLLSWVSVTNLGLSAFVDNDEVLAWVTGLDEGLPVSGAKVTLYPSEASGLTDDDGLVRLPLGPWSEHTSWLVAELGDDSAVLPEHNDFWHDYAGWVVDQPQPAETWYVFDDRGLYKPKETVHFKGWVRDIGQGTDGDVGPWDASHRVWVVEGPRGNEIATGTIELNPGGGFDLEVKLPDDVNLGQAQLRIAPSDSRASWTHVHYFKIEEFRRPEFEVTTQSDPGPHLLGTHIQATVSASYYAGGGLQNADVNWAVYNEPASFTPPGWDEWSFGTWSAWWAAWYEPRTGDVRYTGHSGLTDGAGEHHLDLHVQSMSPARATTLRAEATVMDVNRQAWTSTATLLVHPSARYVGLKSERSFFGDGDEVVLQSIVVDIGGEITLEKPDIEIARMVWQWSPEGWKELPEDAVPCVVEGEGADQICHVVPNAGGRFRALATVVDAEGRPNTTELFFWVSGGPAEPARGVVQENLILIPDAEDYQPGDTAEVLVQVPFWPAQALVLTERNGILSVERHEVSGSSLTVQIPIVEEHIPNVFLAVELVGHKKRVDLRGQDLSDVPDRPAYASGSLDLPVPPRLRTLGVEVAPEHEELSPGGSTSVAVTVVDAGGEPVAEAEVAIVAVDEAVLALSGYEIPDPLGVFYPARGSGVEPVHSRSQVYLADAEAITKAVEQDATAYGANDSGSYGSEAEVMAVSSAPKMALRALGGIGGAKKKSGGKPTAMMPPSPKLVADPQGGQPSPNTAIAIRTDLRALALFEPSLYTNGEGRVVVELDLPDSLTRYRIVAVAVSGAKSFGRGEATVTARKPLMLRPSPPRFLNFGDAPELPVVVQNQTDELMEVDVAMRAANAFFGESEQVAGWRVEVPGRDRVELRFPAHTDSAGIARFQVAAQSGDVADAAAFDFPVWTPATTEAFATYGAIDDGFSVQGVEAPPESWPQFGGLEVTTSSTALQALTDAVLYLVAYRFECNEQLSSRILAVAALRDVLQAFETDGLPPPEEIEDAVQRDLKKLVARQNVDGGWGFWRRYERSWPYLSVHVAHTLGRARSKGYKVPDHSFSSAKNYLRTIKSRLPHYYSEKTKWALRAYALYALHHMDGTDLGPKAAALYREAGIDGLSMEALGWLLPVLHATGATEEVAEIQRHLGNRVAETAGAASFTSSYGEDQGYLILHSDRRTDGILLEALIETAPDSDLITKVVTGLLAHRTRGHWGNTQENAFVLLALDSYFRTFEAETPDFVARVWLGDGFAGEHKFEGRTTERAHFDIPMAVLAEHNGVQPVAVAKEGPGRLYYRMGLRYAPRDLTLDPADRGFTVTRTYHAVDDPSDVTHDDDGTWHFRPGAEIEVELTLVAPSRRYHVALVDPLPAGLEPLNPALATTGTLPEDVGGSDVGYWWWSRPWFEHQNLRDERVEAFTSLLPAGVHTYRYAARATTPGQFVVPPTRAEEMYSPEVFGRTGTSHVVVDAPEIDEVHEVLEPAQP